MSKKEIPDFTQNRELSWLRFNQRVLEEARDESVPLMERMKFVAIFTSNLDEFFMIRVGSLYDLAATDDKKIDQRSGMTAKQQLDAIYRAVSPLYKERDKTYAEIKKQLHPYGVCGLDFKELEQQEKKFVKKYFKNLSKPYDGWENLVRESAKNYDIFLCGSAVPVSGGHAVCSGRRSVPAHQLYLHHCSAGLCLRQLCAEPCQRGSAPETAQHHRTAAVLQCCGGAAVSRAGADAVPGESRRIAGTLVSVVQAAGCAVFAALQPLQHGCDCVVSLLGKNHFSGALESAACGGGVGNLCPCPKRVPAGGTAV